MLIEKNENAINVNCDDMNTMNWIPISTRLCGVMVELHPMDDSHVEELAAVGDDARIWVHYTNSMSTQEQRAEAFRAAIVACERGDEFPFVVVARGSGRIIGSTRLLNLNKTGRKLEIGWTWLHPTFWSTGVNLECKLMLLKFCFEDLKVIRVQLKTDENNVRSRMAIVKIGARFEGVLRNDMIRDDGSFRNSAYFSIIDSEWNEVQSNICLRLARITG